MPRRRFTRREVGAAGAGVAASMLEGCVRRSAFKLDPLEVSCRQSDHHDVDYVVVGSGAGGGPLACNLARGGYKVVLLEAGGDPRSWTRDVPALHPLASEDAAMSWDFFVRTYADDAQQKRNAKYLVNRGGVLYPRAGTLGGCTAHNAMITLCPHNSDWDAIAKTFDDPTWSAGEMRRYFERLEHCDYAPRSAASRHGFDGWLHTALSPIGLALGDAGLRTIVEAAIAEASTLDPSLYGDAVKMALNPDQALWDPNDWRLLQAAAEGMVFVPMHQRQRTRESTRDYIHATMAQCPGNLTLELNALATKVILDADRRAVGVEYLSGERLYRASRNPEGRAQAGEQRSIRVKREVILCGGVFNSPQLLMLSGIGPAEQLKRFGIEVAVDLPGVGKNLQDRYEIGVVHELSRDLSVLADMRQQEPDPAEPDPELQRWWSDRTGPYGTNGIVGALVKKSKPTLATPDLFVFGLVGQFKGYYPGYSKDLSADRHHFTWGVLKAHTQNQGGEVRLHSSDPRDPPEINFHYFQEGTPGFEEDVEAVVEGVLTARRIMGRLSKDATREVLPGPQVATREQISQHVRDNAWGHHASCTNKMGLKSDPTAVVDQRFRVHGTTGLRVVDASVFPRIPGFFVVGAVYMVAEKASDVILADAAVTPA